MMLGDILILGPVPSARTFIAQKRCANSIGILMVNSSSRAQLVPDRKKGILDGILERGTLLELKY